MGVCFCCIIRQHCTNSIFCTNSKDGGNVSYGRPCCTALISCTWNGRTRAKRKACLLMEPEMWCKASVPHVATSADAESLISITAPSAIAKTCRSWGPFHAFKHFARSPKQTSATSPRRCHLSPFQAQACEPDSAAFARLLVPP